MVPKRDTKNNGVVTNSFTNGSIWSQESDLSGVSRRSEWAVSNSTPRFETGYMMVFAKLLVLLCSICRMGTVKLCFILCHDYRLVALTAGILSCCKSDLVVKGKGFRHMVDDRNVMLVSRR